MKESIKEKYLGRRDLFGLRYNEGIIFCEVEEYEDLNYDGYSRIGEVSSGSSSSFSRLDDASGEDILFVPQDRSDVVMHVGIGVAPSQIEVYTSYPEGDRSYRSLPNLSQQPTPGSNFGHFDSNDSPYRTPGQLSELVIPPNQHASFSFQNTGSDAHEPALNLSIRKYRINVLGFTQSNQKAIKRIIKSGSPAPIFAVGNFKNKASFNLGDTWDVSPQTRDETMRKMRGR